MNILFVCKYNRFRSKVAEAIFNKINKNKNNKAKSAGIIEGEKINKDILIANKLLGIKIKQRPSGLKDKLLKNQDLIIIVADNVPKSIFEKYVNENKKLKVWKIHDTENNKERKNIVNNIYKKVENLIEELN